MQMMKRKKLMPTTLMVLVPWWRSVDCCRSILATPC